MVNVGLPPGEGLGGEVLAVAAYNRGEGVGAGICDGGGGDRGGGVVCEDGAGVLEGPAEEGRFEG